MRREACTAVGRGVEYLEHQGLVTLHAREVEPALSRIEFELIRLAHTIRIAALGTHEILGGHAAGIDDRERISLDGRLDGTPHLDDCEATLQQRRRFCAQN